MKNGVTLDQVLRTSANALSVSPLTFVEASNPGLGGFVDTANQRIEIQHNQPIKSAQELGRVTIQGAEDRQLHLADVATITEDHQLLIGDAVVSDAPRLILVVERYPGAKVADVTKRVEAALEELSPGLAGVQLDTTLYRPAAFVDQMVDNVAWALGIGALMVLLRHRRPAVQLALGRGRAWPRSACRSGSTLLFLSWFGAAAQHDVHRRTGDGGGRSRRRCDPRC